MSDRGSPSPAPTESSASPADPEAEAPEAEAEPIEISDSPFSLIGEEQDATEVEAPPSRRRARTIVLSTMLAVSVAGLATIGWFGWQISSQKDATLSTPATIGDYALDTGEAATSSAEYLQTALSAEVDLDETIGAVYTDAAEQSVLVFGGTTLIWSPARDLETSFSLVSDSDGGITGLRDVDAGDLGGSMKCGTTRSDSGDISVCGWADHGSLALTIFPSGLAVSDAARVTAQFREAIQTRS
ncbi:hypothetical protein [Actinoplanes sp. NPDC051851]|uniref:hypothetical protein n=1 Tax=Actinoplanes sp. NPDC051851 TaxID=3154753 RepID=UPI003425524A